MKKVELRMNEQNKYEIIKKLVETGKEEIHAWKPWKTARFCSSFRYKE